jgi:hypothetical protein
MAYVSYDDKFLRLVELLKYHFIGVITDLRPQPRHKTSTTHY